MKYSFDSGDFGHLREDNIESEICLLLRDSSYTSVMSSHYTSGSDINNYLTADSKEDMNNKLDYYSNSNNSFVYQKVSIDT